MTWSYVQYGAEWQVEEGQSLVASVYGDESRAKLAAAAPEMLHALKEVANYMDDGDEPILSEVRAAIARAGGLEQ